MPQYEIKIGRLKKRVRIIRDPELINAEKNRFELYLKAKADLLKIDEEIEKQKELEKQAEIERLKEELEEQKKIQHERWLKEKPEVRYFQEFTLTNESQVIELDMSRILEDAVPISIAKEQIQRAYEDGMQDGQLQAKSEFKREIEQYQSWIKRIESTAESLRKEHYEELERRQNTIIELSMLIAEQILYTELNEDENAIVKRVSGILESIKNEKVFKIHVNPEAVSVLRQAGSTLLEDPEQSKDIIIYGNPTTPVGSAVLETSAGLIDARVKNQLTKIQDALEEEANRTFETREMQDRIDEVYGEKETQKDLDITDQTLDESTAIDPIEQPDDFDLSDVPEEYHEFFDQGGFGIEDLDPKGKKYDDEIIEDYSEEKQSQQKEEPEEQLDVIDYEKEYEDYLDAQEEAASNKEVVFESEESDDQDEDIKFDLGDDRDFEADFGNDEEEDD